jgi:phosphoribosylformylglycinamidine synthase
VKFGIVVFPGTWSDRDCYHAVTEVLHQPAGFVWHQDTDLSGYGCIVLPGGFSYGDYLRPGAIARFSPVMSAVERFAAEGRLVLGICNGFQILCEAGLLPGVLMPNSHLEYRCQWTHIKVESIQTPFTNRCSPGQVLRVPISHYEGNYYTDDETLSELEAGGRVVFRYTTPEGEVTPEANPNGTLHNIAGITNRDGNVLGMMPHPERACEDLLGSADGLPIFRSLMASGAKLLHSSARA